MRLFNTVTYPLLSHRFKEAGALERVVIVGKATKGISSRFEVRRERHPQGSKFEFEGERIRKLVIEKEEM
jgi:hypothetical protein